MRKIVVILVLLLGGSAAGYAVLGGYTPLYTSDKKILREQTRQMEDGVVSQLDVAQLAIGMVGGLALFLFGLTQLTDALQTAAGDRLRKLLGKFTSNRFMGVGTGASKKAAEQAAAEEALDQLESE